MGFGRSGPLTPNLIYSRSNTSKYSNLYSILIKCVKYIKKFQKILSSHTANNGVSMSQLQFDELCRYAEVNLGHNISQCFFLGSYKKSQMNLQAYIQYKSIYEAYIVICFSRKAVRQSHNMLIDLLFDLQVVFQ